MTNFRGPVIIRGVPYFNAIKQKERRNKILSKKQDARQQIELISIDQLVPEDHLLRKIEIRDVQN